MDLDAPTLVLGGSAPETEAEQPVGAIGEDDPLLDLLNDVPSAAPVCGSAVTPSASSSSSSSSTLAPTVVGNSDEQRSAEKKQPSTFSRAATQTLDLNMDETLDIAEDDGSFEVVPAPPSSLCCARLVSTNASTAEDVILDADSITVGREEACTAVLQDLRVSGEQFRVHRSAGIGGTWHYDLEDISRNGTVVSKKVVKGGAVRLRDNDLIEVLPATKVGRAEAIAFLFQGSASVAPVPSPCRASASSLQEEPPTKKARTSDALGEVAKAEKPDSTEDLFEFAICVICQEVIHRATSIQPCGHNFCSACLGTWLKRPSKWGRTCPVCRKEVASVSRQHQMDGLIQGLLKAHPSKGRSEKELADVDAQDALIAAGYDLSRLTGHSLSASSSGGLGGIHFGRMPVTAVAATAAAMAGLPSHLAGVAVGAAAVAAGELEHDSDDEEDNDDDSDDHSEASSASAAAAPPFALFGRPPGPPCFHCRQASWRTLGEAAENVAGTSAPGRASTAFVRQALAQNDFERGILEEWLTVQGQGLGAKLLEILETPNPSGVAPVRVNLPEPGVVIFGAPSTAAIPLPATAMPEGSWVGLHGCRSCCMGVLRSLTYSLRERIPEVELPLRARGRQNCWYGQGCRTQIHKPEHAARLNHICEQTRF